MTEITNWQPVASTKPSVPFIQKILLFVVAAVAIILDQLSKFVVESSIPLNTSWSPIPEWAHLFQLTHTSNTGAAFGTFQGGGAVFGIVAMIVGGVIIYYNFTLPVGHFLLRIALGLQLGGALGNLIDRIRLGHVTDFLDFGPWYIFNLADLWVVSGVVILALLMWQEDRVAKQSTTETPAAH